MLTSKPETYIGFFTGARTYSHHSRSSRGPTVYGDGRSCRPCFGFRNFLFAASAEPSGRSRAATTATATSVRMFDDRYAVSPGSVKRIPRFRGCRRASEARQVALGLRQDAL